MAKKFLELIKKTLSNVRMRIYTFQKHYGFIDILTSVILIIVMCFMIKKKTVAYFVDKLDITILFSFAVFLIARIVSTVIGGLIESLLEDSGKLNDDICKRYNKENCYKIGEISLPVVLIGDENKSISSFSVTDDNDGEYYHLPSFIEWHSDELMTAHSKSHINNNTMIRCDRIDIDEKGKNKVTLYTRRTTYYDSLITNKAMDYVLKCNRTIRDMYDPGPYLKDLENSKMSNHLGFNGYIISNDNCAILIKRSHHVAVNKSKWSCSVSASLKLKYSVNENGKVTQDTIIEGVKQEIKDELFLDINESNIRIFRFYRDLIQGGKPEFFFYAESEKNSDEIIKEFKDGCKKTSRDSMRNDGRKIVAADISSFINSQVSKEIYKQKDEKITGIELPNKKGKKKVYKMGAISIVCFDQVMKAKKES